MDAAVRQRFQKATGATIAWDTYSSSSEEQTKLQTAIVSGTGPDVFSFGASFVPTAQATKGFTVLTDQDWQAVGGKAKFFQQQLTMAGSSPNQLISVPFVMRPFVMVYNNEVATHRYDPSHVKPLLDQANQQIQSQLH